jgi:hypothetical protein
MTLHAGYAASPISANQKGSTKHIQMVAGRRNQSFFVFNHFRKPCNHPNFYAAVEIRASCV